MRRVRVLTACALVFIFVGQEVQGRVLQPPKQREPEVELDDVKMVPLRPITTTKTRTKRQAFGANFLNGIRNRPVVGGNTSAFGTNPGPIGGNFGEENILNSENGYGLGTDATSTGVGPNGNGGGQTRAPQVPQIPAGNVGSQVPAGNGGFQFPDDSETGDQSTLNQIFGPQNNQQGGQQNVDYNRPNFGNVQQFNPRPANPWLGGGGINPPVVQPSNPWLNPAMPNFGQPTMPEFPAPSWNREYNPGYNNYRDFMPQWRTTPC